MLLIPKERSKEVTRPVLQPATLPQPSSDGGNGLVALPWLVLLHKYHGLQ